MIVIGIDPGVVTGFAVWDFESRKMVSLSSMPIHRAMSWISSEETESPVLILVEDARQRKFFGKTGKEVWQGAGSIKRDCKIWEDYLTDLGIPFFMLPPRKIKTKVNARDFKIITGWKESTNEHSRDAAMSVWGLTDSHVQTYLRQIKAFSS